MGRPGIQWDGIVWATPSELGCVGWSSPMHDDARSGLGRILTTFSELGTELAGEPELEADRWSALALRSQNCRERGLVETRPSTSMVNGCMHACLVPVYLLQCSTPWHWLRFNQMPRRRAETIVGLGTAAPGWSGAGAGVVSVSQLSHPNRHVLDRGARCRGCSLVACCAPC